ncbi:interphotoreceptor matrix proteoglycan 2-like [Salvelinus fontinalis]|uniref:interphotoreceptor matrix proteoglycan 2-like n=1 Tax=Salvelinus fontinalis TaxID=8038 RepID=UPI00248569CA|nr:interphotoreceptor matrix proteoglycan 2-like [Salvelinus fontinalis]
MSDSSLKCLLCTLSFVLAFELLGIRTDAASGEGPLLPDGQDLYYKTVRISPILSVPQSIVHLPLLKVSHKDHGAILRQKRNVLFPSGVKLCAEESVQQSIANHLSYFHLRVCQETVWEAFKIFWDRLPNQEEYQTWMSQCLDGTATALAMGKNFSQSKEHLALVESVSLSSLHEITIIITPTPATEQEAQGEVIIEGAEVELPTEPTNDIEMEVLVRPTRAQLEHVVELSILLKGERYSDALRDTASFQYQTLNQQFIDKIEDALGELPGLKSVTVLEFRFQKDAQGLDGVVVVYAVTVEVEGEEVSSEQLDYLTRQSNLVENSYRDLKERPTVVYNITDFRNNITEALQNDNIIRDTTPVSSVPESIKSTAGITKDDCVEEILAAEMTPHAPEVKTEDVAMGENDVIVLEEIVTLPPEPEVTINDTAMEEEGLLLGNTVAVESPPLERFPADPISPEQPEGTTLPKPPLEIEASGSGVDRLEDLPFQPEEEEKPEEILTEEAEAGVEEEVVEVPEEEEEAVEVSDTVEVLEEEAEPSEILEYSILETETIEELEEKNPAFLPVEAMEAPEPAESLNVPKNAMETVPPDEPEEGANEVLGHPEKSGYGEVVTSLEEGPIIEEPVTGEDALEVEEEVMELLDLTETSAENLVEDEMLLVDEVVPEAAHPTTLSAEKESPFTQVSDAIAEEEATEATGLDTAPEPEADAEDQGVTPALTPAKYYPGPDISITLELQTIDPVTDYDLVPFGGTNQTEEGSSGYPSGGVHGVDHSVAMPINPGRALMVFFSLRVTNMKFSDDLFNKSSPEYKALEQRFTELLLPYLQSNLSNFQNLEILNFRNGSIVVNSRMKFGKPVPRSVNNAVYLILEDFANTAYKTMNLAIDKYSLDVESGDQANQCKFQACNEFAQCSVNRWSGEAECVCNAGYFSVDGLPCQSICDLQTDFCMNDGKCDIIPGQGVICRCRVGENWWYRGEHCEEYVSELLVVGIAIASVAGFLLVASGVIFFLARTLRDQYDKDETEDPLRRGESIPSLERATKYNPMYESEATTGYSHYYRRYPEAPLYSSASAEASTDFSSEEIRHIYENSELTKEEIQDRIRIIELYAKDRKFADFVRQHQTALDTRRESVST